MPLPKKTSLALNVLLIALLIYTFFFPNTKGPKSMSFRVGEEAEVTTPGSLLNSTGQLVEAGWSRRYLKQFSFESVRPLFLDSRFLTRMRYKRFNFYSMTFDQKIVQLAIANINYGASVFFNFFDFAGNRYFGKSEAFLPLIHSRLFPQLIDDPFDCQTNSLAINKNDLELRVETTKEEGHCLSKVELKWGKEVRAEFLISRSFAEEDAFNIVPISSDFRYFFYSQKSYNNKCRGHLQIQEKHLEINEDGCLGMSDLGRGILPYRTSWIWASASGLTVDGRRLSLNLGEGVSDIRTFAVEDLVKLEGKIIKLNPLELFYDPQNLMRGVSLRTHKNHSSLENSAEIFFQPSEMHLNKENLIFMATKLTYLFGTYSGKFYDYEGRSWEFREMFGVIEFANLRW